MPSDLDNLKARKSAVLTELAAMGTKPDYSIDGQSVQWTSYRLSLLNELQMLNELIEQTEPYDIRTQVM